MDPRGDEEEPMENTFAVIELAESHRKKKEI